MTQKHKVPKKYRQICDDIQRGFTLKHLFEKYSSKEGGDSFLNVGLAAISTLKPSLYDKLFGAPPALDGLTLLADACFRHRAIHHLHEYVGRTHAIRFVPGINQNASDKLVFDFAIERGYGAIVTYDCRRSTSGDHTHNICDYAEYRFRLNQEQHSSENLPGIILLPNGQEEKAIRQNTEEIMEYSLNVPTQILDLRQNTRSSAKPPSRPQTSDASVSQHQPYF